MLARIPIEELVLVAVFLVAPAAQRIWAWLKERRAKAEAAERERRRDEGTLPPEPAPPARRRRRPELAREAAEGEPDTFWGRMVEAAERELGGEERAGAEPREAAPEARPRRVASAAPAPERAAEAPLGGLADLSGEGAFGELDGLADAPTESQAEAGMRDHGAFAEIQGLERSFRGSGLGGLRGTLAADRPMVAASGPGATLAPIRGRRSLRLGAGGWANAVVLAEVLGPPVTLREPGSGATTPPGLRP